MYLEDYLKKVIQINKKFAKFLILGSRIFIHDFQVIPSFDSLKNEIL